MHRRKMRRTRQRVAKRGLMVEALESRRMLAGLSWQNPENPLDVNDDLRLAPIDVLLGVNRLNSEGSGPLPPRNVVEPPFYDTNGDGQHAPIDLLLPINALNRPVPYLAAKLANDTAPQDATNRDGLTADPTVIGAVSVEAADQLLGTLDGSAPVDLFSHLAGDEFELDPSVLETISGGPLADGSHMLHLEAVDSTGDSAAIDLPFTLDTTAPAPPDFALDADSDTSPTGDKATSAETVTLTGQAEPGALIILEQTGAETTVDSAGNFGLTDVALALGDNPLTVRAIDAAGNENSATITVTRIAELDRSVATTIDRAGAFLYTGDDPIQVGVDPETIEPRRAAILRGNVSDRAGDPLLDVRVNVLNHPEFGHTLTREGGVFDLAVNGGGPLTIQYEKDGFLTVQRQVDVPWQDFAIAPDVVMVSLDDQVTTIDLTSEEPIQVARGGEVTDADGTRQATLLFPEGTTAEMVLPDGSIEPLETLDVRATEYTIGSSGPDAMPAELPPNSGYTYAVELSADEALAAGATQVNFSAPIPFYVENFLDFPAGMAVPAGFYDRQAGMWIASDDGRVIEVIAESGGLAEVDIDGDGAADDATALAGLGITEAEREQLAALYEPGDEMWRVPIPHFTPWDCNWPFGPDENSEEPNQEEPKSDQDEKPDKPCEQEGFSIIECQSQILGERIAVTGTPFTLNYRSDRVPGRAAARTLDISLSGFTIPSSLKRIKLEILVAGRRFTESFPAAPNQSHEFVWDGRDAYGRIVQGTQTATVRIGYVYDGVYRTPGGGPVGALATSFGRFGGAPISGSLAREEITIWQEFEIPISAWDARTQGLSGWSLDVHHAYDPTGSILYRGDGSRRSARTVSSTVETIADPVIQPFGMTVGPDGAAYTTNNNQVVRIGPDGSTMVVAGKGGVFGTGGEGGPATEAELQTLWDVDVGPDGSLYIADRTGSGHGSHPRDVHRILRVDPSGTLTRLADFPASDGFPINLAAAPDGTVYFSQSDTRVGAIAPDGTISTVLEVDPDATPSLSDPSSLLLVPRGLDVGPDGTLYIAEIVNGVILRLSPSGKLEVFAGTLPPVDQDKAIDVRPATEASLCEPRDVAVAPAGSVVITDTCYGTVHQVDSQGFISLVAGFPFEDESSGDGGPARLARFERPFGIAVGPSGDVHVTDIGVADYRRIQPVLPGFSDTDIVIPSEDGTQFYRFDPSGRHLSTLNALTAAVLYEFRYDDGGRLTEIEDGDGNVTTIEHDAEGNATGILAPFDQRTELDTGPNGFLTRITNPADESVSFEYTDDGLLTAKTDARDNGYQYQYDPDGRLIRAEDPAGGFLEMSRSEDDDGFTVTKTTAEGRTTTYRVEQARDADGRFTGETRRLTTFPDGTQTEAVIGEDGRQKIDFADGGRVSMIQGPDPRFGMQAPVLEELTITTPGGLTQEMTTERTVTLAAPNDPLSLQTLTDTVTINGRSTTQTYDAAADTFTTTTAEGHQRIMTLDDQGKPLQFQEGSLAPITVTYDDFGRPERITQGSGARERVMTLRYDTAGNISQVTTPRGGTRTFEDDAAGRLIRDVLPGGEEIRYAYDEEGNITSITAPGRPPYRGSYTAVGLLQEVRPPDAGSDTDPITYSHDLDRQLTSMAVQGEALLEVGYDGAGRIATMTLPRGDINYEYDPDTGLLAGTTAPDGGTLSLHLDTGLPQEATWTGTVSGSVSNEFNDDLRLASQTVNGAGEVDFIYDADRLLGQAGSLAISRNPATGYVSGTEVGGVSDTWTFNEFGELSEYRAASDGTEVFATEVTRNRGGLIAEKRETVDGTTTVFEYAYDANGRLLEVREDGSVRAAYTYDANGNRLSLETPAETITASYDDRDRLLEYGDATYKYSADGRLAGKTEAGKTTDFTYDPLGNLMRVDLPDGRAIEYVVDGLNRRIGKKVDGQLVHGFLYSDLVNPAAELDGAGDVVARFVYGTKSHVPDYMIKGGSTYRIVTDQLGSVRLVIDVDTGDIAQRMDYDAWGNVEVDTNPGFQPFGFAGGLYDRHTGLTRFGVRDYDAGTGRWTTPDPGGFRDGANFYEYVGGDPISRFDPLGLQGEQAGGGPEPAPAPTPPPEPAFPSSGDHLRNMVPVENADIGQIIGEKFPSEPGGTTGRSRDGEWILMYRFEDGPFDILQAPPKSNVCQIRITNWLQDLGRDVFGPKGETSRVGVGVRQ